MKSTCMGSNLPPSKHARQPVGGLLHALPRMRPLLTANSRDALVSQLSTPDTRGPAAGGRPDGGERSAGVNAHHGRALARAPRQQVLAVGNVAAVGPTTMST
ncbi:unnamed protein product [Prorocentrum cordatum]|uniref:Uncharacterized protein n=1 Tax=Prorocentrum cordatum TaxID=2364126 RepID=A0ABN9Y3V0_9DINO|nr:unnamed protein product [Polarella glacialis]